MKIDAKIYVAGHAGLAGSALVRVLSSHGYTSLITRTHTELDLTDSLLVADFFKQTKPEYVFLAAAKVGGIMANRDHPVEFLNENLKIQLNVIEESYRSGVQKLMFLGSTCVYPKEAPQPIKEDYLMTGPLEETNAAYAVAKIAGITMCKAYNKQYGTNFISVMPTNLYGPNDNFDKASSHVLSGFIQRFHEAKITDSPTVTIWGTGKPTRDFLYVDDFAEAAVFLMEKYDSSEIINIGSGKDVSIWDLAILTARVVGYKGTITTDLTKPDGMMRKLADSSKLVNMGWKPQVSLEEGIRRTYDWYLAHQNANAKSN